VPVVTVVPIHVLVTLVKVQVVRVIRITLVRSRAPVVAVLTIVVELITVAIASRGKIIETVIFTEKQRRGYSIKIPIFTTRHFLIYHLFQTDGQTAILY
jgi:hypothetical protein